MILLQTAEYALRAALYIASKYPRAVNVHEMAREIHAPRNYLSKTLHKLVRAGVLSSTRGPAGGFRLTASPERQSLGSIASAVSLAKPARCLLGHGTCGEHPECTVHHRWKPIATEVQAFLGTTTLADLLSEESRAPAREDPSARPSIPSSL